MKFLFVLLSLLVVVTVFWYLQNPFGALQSTGDTGKERCVSSDQETGGQTGTSHSVLACGQIQIAERTGPETLVTHVRLFQFDGVDTQWTLEAPQARNEEEKGITVQQPSLTIHQKNGPKVSVTSVLGTINHHSRAMVFSGKVVAVNGTQRLSTDILRFDPDERILYTDREFLMVDGPMRLEGVGLTLYQEMKKLVIPRRVRIQIQSEVPGIMEPSAPALQPDRAKPVGRVGQFGPVGPTVLPRYLTTYKYLKRSVSAVV